MDVLDTLQVRRGADRAEIYSLAFSSTAQWLAVSSDKGTVHVFNLKVNSGSSGNENPRSASDPNLAVSSSNSSLSFIRGKLCLSLVLLFHHQQMIKLFWFVCCSKHSRFAIDNQFVRGYMYHIKSLYIASRERIRSYRYDLRTTFVYASGT